MTSVDATGLTATDADGRARRYDAGTVLWTAGVEAPALAERLASPPVRPHDRAGRIKVNPDLTVPGHPEIFVVGDVMQSRLAARAR